VAFSLFARLTLDLFALIGSPIYFRLFAIRGSPKIYLLGSPKRSLFNFHSRIIQGGSDIGSPKIGTNWVVDNYFLCDLYHTSYPQATWFFERLFEAPLRGLHAGGFSLSNY
jgi:hypothetical protein